ncbi:hypothetical protein MMC21_005321 [Puttea exsequens]|nr:hypothetical protein [Puttea exsequens]
MGISLWAPYVPRTGTDVLDPLTKTSVQQLTTKPIPVDMIEGNFHFIWTYCNGQSRTLDWNAENDPPQLEDWNIAIQRDRDKKNERHFVISLHFGTLALEWTMKYEDSIINKMILGANHSAGRGELETTSFLTWSSVRDEQGDPYLKCSITTNEHEPGEDMVTMEVVAKRTDPTGAGVLGLTKNEKLRLGYAVWDDGQFEPDNEDEGLSHNPDMLSRQLRKHAEAIQEIHKKLVYNKTVADIHLANVTLGVAQMSEQLMRSANQAKGLGRSRLEPRATAGASTTTGPAKRGRGRPAVIDDDASESPMPPSKRRRAFQGQGPADTPSSMEQDDGEATHGGYVVAKRGGLSKRGFTRKRGVKFTKRKRG